MKKIFLSVLFVMYSFVIHASACEIPSSGFIQVQGPTSMIDIPVSRCNQSAESTSFYLSQDFKIETEQLVFSLKAGYPFETDHTVKNIIRIELSYHTGENSAFLKLSGRKVPLYNYITFFPGLKIQRSILSGLTPITEGNGKSFLITDAVNFYPSGGIKSFMPSTSKNLLRNMWLKCGLYKRLLNVTLDESGYLSKFTHIKRWGRIVETGYGVTQTCELEYNAGDKKDFSVSCDIDGNETQSN